MQSLVGETTAVVTLTHTHTNTHTHTHTHAHIFHYLACYTLCVSIIHVCVRVCVLSVPGEVRHNCVPYTGVASVSTHTHMSRCVLYTMCVHYICVCIMCAERRSTALGGKRHNVHIHVTVATGQYAQFMGSLACGCKLQASMPSACISFFLFVP